MAPAFFSAAARQTRMTPAAYPLPYCLNVHRADSWRDLRRALRTDLLRIRSLVAPDRPFPIGLYLSASAAADLDSSPRRLGDFRRWLTANGLFISTLNAFPAGRFHASALKTNVYRPDWRHPQRLAYTRRCACLLAALLPEGATASISTVPGGWARDWRNLPRDSDRALRQLNAAALTLCRLRAETGRTIRLALEPEPGCIWTLADPRIENDLPPEIGWCLDTCHSAVDFRPLPTPRSPLWKRIFRVQLSAALEAFNTPEAHEALRAYAEPVYLHQTRLAVNGHILAAWDDLPAALRDLPNYPARAHIRIHFHVPLTWAGTGPLRSTRAWMSPAFLRTAGQRVPCEVETYTYSVFPPALHAAAPDLPHAIANELEWARRACFG